MYHKTTEVDVVNWIRTTAYKCSDLRNDGFTAWGLKQDLYLLQFIIDSALANCPHFEPEQAWLKEQEQKKIIKLLKDGK